MTEPVNLHAVAVGVAVGVAERLHEEHPEWGDFEDCWEPDENTNEVHFSFDSGAVLSVTVTARMVVAQEVKE